MTTFMEFLTSREVLIVVLLAVAICIIGTMYFILEKVYHNLKNKNIRFSIPKEDKIIKIENNTVVVEPAKAEEKTPVVQAIEEIKEEDEPLIVEPVKEESIPVVVEEKKDERLVIPVEEIEERKVEDILEEVKQEVKKEQEELQYTEIEPNAEEAKEEIRKATEELLKTQQLQALDAIDITKFEEEQEENAIISIDELYKKSKVLHDQEEVIKYEDEGDEPISLADLEARMNKIKVDMEELEEEQTPVQQVLEVNEQPTVKLDDFNTISIDEAYKEDKIFKSSPIISPIFGIEKNISTNDMELENTANYEKLDDEIKKTNEFLKVLKELQKKLE